jgi:hypothetical protein
MRRHWSRVILRPRGPRSGPGYSVPVHQRLSAPSDPLAGTSRRGSGNQVVLSDGRISRSAAAIITDERYCLKPSPPSGRVAESSQL